jgi:hypothetical protein
MRSIAAWGNRIIRIIRRRHAFKMLAARVKTKFPHPLQSFPQHVNRCAHTTRRQSKKTLEQAEQKMKWLRQRSESDNPDTWRACFGHNCAQETYESLEITGSVPKNPLHGRNLTPTGLLNWFLHPGIKNTCGPHKGEISKPAVIAEHWQ